MIGCRDNHEIDAIRSRRLCPCHLFKRIVRAVQIPGARGVRGALSIGGHRTRDDLRLSIQSSGDTMHVANERSQATANDTGAQFPLRYISAHCFATFLVIAHSVH